MTEEYNEVQGDRYWSPYYAGIGLGLTLLASFVILGTGLGASGSIARCAAWLEHFIMPGHVASSAYFGPWFAGGEPHVMRYYLVLMAIGVLIGGGYSARRSRRYKHMVERGPSVSAKSRIIYAFIGGGLCGFASRLARGCTSGQALTGTAMLFTGSVVFLVCLFAGAYITAYFVRRQWL